MSTPMFSISTQSRDFYRQSASEFNAFQSNSLRNGSGKIFYEAGKLLE
jgi:hypothetical protein